MADKPKFVLFAIRGMPEKEVKFVRRMQEEFKKIRIDCIQCEGNQDFDIGLSISDAGHELEDGIILTSADYSSEWLLSSGLTTVIFDETLGENLPYGFDMIVESFEEIDADFFVKLWKHKNNIPCIISESKRTVLRELCEKDIDEVIKISREEHILKFVEDGRVPEEEQKEKLLAYIRNVYRFYDYGIWGIFDSII